MGYLSNANNEIIVDAILTKYGRQKLASGQQLGIVKYALSDDEIDYTLYNAANLYGSDFFDLAIRSLPILEPVPSSTRQFRYYLYTSATQVTFSYTLVPSVPSQFTSVGTVQTGWTGMAIGASYAFGVSVSPAPPNPSQVWFSCRMPIAYTNNLKLSGMIDQSIGVPQDLAKIIQTYGGTVATFSDSVVAYGHSFSLELLSVRSARTTATLVMDAANVAVAAANIQVVIPQLSDIAS